MEFFSGMFKNTLDDKARLTFPAKLRDSLPGSSVVVTQGIEPCLWLFPSEYWESLVRKIMEKTSLFNESSRMIQRWLIAPAQEVEIDKAGRISIPQSLREHAKLAEGAECVVAGVIKRIEIWDSLEYGRYWEPRSASVVQAVESQLGDIGM
jgi:MraZ protein